MATAHALLAALWCWCCCAERAATRRDALLAQARLRLLDWYSNKSLLEAPQYRNGANVTLLRTDLTCGKSSMPVTFTEFDIPGVEPLDVFATILDTAVQPEWNSKCVGQNLLGDWPEEGIRGWAITFEYPIVGKRTITQWQAAHANLQTKEFWLAVSSKDSGLLADLRQTKHVTPGVYSADNCLGAFHIMPGPNGTHVVNTGHMNLNTWNLGSPHNMLKLFPKSWDMAVAYAQELTERSKHLAKTNGSGAVLRGLDYMFHPPMCPGIYKDMYVAQYGCEEGQGGDF